MPLVVQQDLVRGYGNSHVEAVESLLDELESYPDVRIVALASVVDKSKHFITAVVETI